MKLILQGFYPNSTQNATFNEFTAVSKLFNPFMTSIFSTSEKRSLPFTTRKEIQKDSKSTEFP